MTLQEFIEKAIRTPFLWRGRDYNGFDCFGLVVRFYEDVLGITIETYLDCYEDSDDRNFRKLSHMFNNEKATAWRREETPSEGSVAIILRRNLPIHVGLFLSNNTILHCEENVGTIIEPATPMRIEGFYRPT